MKSVQGLLIAVVLGLAGATLNWFYLEQRSRDVEKVAFIGIKEGTTIKQGDLLREDQLVPVEIPRNATGTLKDFAYYYHDLATVVGQSPNRSYVGGELLLRQDMRTPPAELKLAGADERALSIPVDTSSFIPSLVVPGRKVDFLVSRSESIGVPTPADGSEAAAGPNVVLGGSEIIGPFRVLSLGNRLGSSEVMQASHIPQVQENVMTISVKVVGDELEPKAKKLWEALRRTNFRGVGVLLHPRNEKDE
jgi:Flp pilus assembly protein CpaB